MKSLYGVLVALVVSVSMFVGTGEAAKKAELTVEGTANVVSNPVAGTVYTQAHGLKGIPSFFEFYYECVVAELGYSVGDRVTPGQSSSNAAADGFVIQYDATNTSIIFGQATPILILHKSTPGLYVAGTPANWSVVVKPYLVVTP